MTTGSVLAQFTITLSQAVSEQVAVEWHTSDGTALAGVDYASAKGTVLFAPGETGKTVDILVHGRAVGSEDRSFFVEMLPPTNAILGASIGECIIHVDTTGSTPVTQIIVPTGPQGLQGKSAYQSWLDLGNTGTEEDFINSLKPSAAEIAEEVAPLLDVGAASVISDGTDALGHPDATTVKVVARRVAYSAGAKIATVALAAGDNLLATTDMAGDVVDFNSINFYPRILRGSFFIALPWLVDQSGKLLVKNADAGDVLYACQYDFISDHAAENSISSIVAPVGSQAFEALRRSYKESGLNVAGTFSAGFTIANANDIGIDEVSGKGYSGSIGNVDPDTDPVAGGFTDVSASTPAKSGITALRGAVGGTDSIIFIYGYHAPHDGGGGSFIWDADKPKSEHDGGMVIDPDAAFPADWNNETLREAWFNSSNAGTGCWVRQGDGVSTRKMFGLGSYSMGGDVINEKDFATFSPSITPPDITGYTVSGFTVSGGVATLSAPTVSASLKYPLTLTRNKMYLIKVTVITTARGRLHITLGGVSPYKDNANGYFLTPKLPMLDPDERGQVLSPNVYSFAMLCETIKAGKENIEISVNQVGWTGSVSSVSVQEVEESSFLIAGIAKAEDDALFPTDIVTPTENNPLGLKVGRNWFGCLSVGDRQTGPLYQFGGNAPDDGYGYGGFNLAFGKRALATCTLGMQNSAFGVDCMTYTEGSHNAGFGYSALKFNTKGQQLSAFGYKCLVSNTIGWNNSGFGFWAGALNQEGDNNTYLGAYTGNCERGNRCTYGGAEAGIINQNGNDNSYYGFQSGYYISRLFGGATWSEQCAFGAYSQVNGNGTIAFGVRAIAGVKDGFTTNRADAISIGRDSNAAGGSSVTLGALSKATGQNDVSVGRNSGTTNVTGGNNTFMGNNAGSTTAAGVTNSSALGSNALITGSNQVQLGNSETTTYVYGTVQNRSDAEDKTDVRDTELGIEFIMGLRPVDGRWDMRDDYWEEYQVQIGIDDSAEPVFETRRRQLPKDGSKARSRFHHWFIAQEVKELCDKLGVDFGGYQDHSINGGDDVKTLGYDEFIPPAVKAVQQCWARLDELEERISKLEA